MVRVTTAVLGLLGMLAVPSATAFTPTSLVDKSNVNSAARLNPNNSFASVVNKMVAGGASATGQEYYEGERRLSVFLAP